MIYYYLISLRRVKVEIDHHPQLVVDPIPLVISISEIEKIDY